jgi:hypothetical protein
VCIVLIGMLYPISQNNHDVLQLRFTGDQSHWKHSDVLKSVTECYKDVLYWPLDVFKKINCDPTCKRGL